MAYMMLFLQHLLSTVRNKIKTMSTIYRSYK